MAHAADDAATVTSARHPPAAPLPPLALPTRIYTPHASRTDATRPNAGTRTIRSSSSFSSASEGARDDALHLPKPPSFYPHLAPLPLPAPPRNKSPSFSIRLYFHPLSSPSSVFAAPRSFDPIPRDSARSGGSRAMHWHRRPRLNYRTGENKKEPTDATVVALT